VIFSLFNFVEGAKVFSKDGREIGIVTSGGPSPTLHENIAMGYVKGEFRKLGMPVDIQVRGKMRPATITKLPFIEAKYYK